MFGARVDYEFVYTRGGRIERLKRGTLGPWTRRNPFEKEKRVKKAVGGNNLTVQGLNCNCGLAYYVATKAKLFQITWTYTSRGVGVL